MSDPSLTVNYRFLSDAQYFSAFSMGFISCILSIFGSTNIIYLVSTRRHVWRDKDQLYHRLVMGLSIMDIVTTVAIFVAPYVNRKDTNLYWARGNAATCEWGGFFFQFFIGSTFYSCMLSIYFVRTIRYNKTAAKAFSCELWVHVAAFCIPLAFGIAGILSDVFNPSLLLGFCEFSPYPWNCLFSDEVECERGEAMDMVNIPHIVLYMLLSFTGIVCTWLVYWTIRKQARTHQMWNGTESGLDDVQRRRTRAVGMQAVWYTLAFLIAFVSALFLAVLNAIYPPEIQEASDLEGEGVVFVGILFIYVFFPVQGFLNWIIYVRPRLIRWKDANPDESWLWAYRRVLSGKKAPTTVRTHHLATRPIIISDSNKTDDSRPSTKTPLEPLDQSSKLQDQSTCACGVSNNHNSCDPTDGPHVTWIANGDGKTVFNIERNP